MKYNYFFFGSKTRNGFTLIELLVVISIIGLLASVVLVFFPMTNKKMRDSIRKNDIHQIIMTLEIYYSIHEEYPQSGGAIFPNGGWDNSGDSSWDNLESVLFEEGLLLRDPINESGGWAGSGEYVYNYYSRDYGCDQQWYMIVYTLEDKNDPDLGNSPGATACEGDPFNYPGTITIGECRGCYE